MKLPKNSPRPVRKGLLPAPAAHAKAPEAAPAATPAAPPAPATSQYVVTIDNATGIPMKIEMLDTLTSKRKELTAAEYALAAGFSSGTEASPPLSVSDANAVVEAYYRGVTDYLEAISKKD